MSKDSDIIEQVAEIAYWAGKTQSAQDAAQQIDQLYRKTRHCQWAHSANDLSDYWETTCGNEFSLDDGSPSENDMKYCPFCGGSIKQELSDD